MLPSGADAGRSMQTGEGSGLMRVATYQRSIRASIERVWENVFDWEHLPWLHRDSFCGLEHVESGPWGWRVHVGLPPADRSRRISLELLVEAEASRYVTRTIGGLGKGTEIWTRLSATDEETTDIEVEFLLPDVKPEQVDALGAAMTTLYTKLWDEDELMMMRRTQLLATGVADGEKSMCLGTAAEVRTRTPFEVELGGRSYRVLELDGELLAHTTVCPHLLGPLGDAEVRDGRVVCPWHGYEFDLRTGRSCDGRSLRLRPRPKLEIDPDSTRVTLSLPP
jgi:nitrite reductase/ring-hydroxylating ferredoxin subunit